MTRIVKTLFLGDAQSGKSALIRRIKDPSAPFQTNYTPTLGQEIFSIKNDNDITLQIWDIAGQPQYQIPRDQYYKKAGMAIYCVDFSVYQESKLQAIRDTIEECRAAAPGIPIILVATKADAVKIGGAKRQLQQLGRSLGIPFLITAAKINEPQNLVKKLFAIAERIIATIGVSTTNPAPEGSKTVFPASYTAMWKNGANTTASTLDLLADYCKFSEGYSPGFFSGVKLACTLHWNRKNIEAVRKVILHFQKEPPDTFMVNDILTQLKLELELAGHTINLEGSLATRLEFIHQQAALQEDIEPLDLEALNQDISTSNTHELSSSFK